MTDISGFPDYTINEKGEIYNTKMQKFIKTVLENRGYKMVYLIAGNRGKDLYVHHLVYQTFILKIGEEMPSEIEHINKKKTDNSKDNLRLPLIEDLQPRREKKIHVASTGHKNIRKTKHNTFEVRINLENGIKPYSKTFKTLEDAIDYRDM